MSDADLVAHRASQVITAMGAEIRELRASRDRYRMAWLSARQRAVRLADEDDTVHSCFGRWGGSDCRCFD
jgi:hypothetical protein